MTTYVIDIKARSFPEGRRIWRLTPGDKYRFLPTFRKQSVVFLDVPGLHLTGDRLDRHTPMLNERILMSQAVGEWAHELVAFQRRGQVGEPPVAPSRDLKSYADIPLRGGQPNRRGFIINFFGEAQVGDLVVVPGPIPERTVWIGEFLDPPQVVEPAYDQYYGEEAIPARRVKWFPPVSELDVSSDLSAMLRTSIAFVTVARHFYTEILDATYGTYQLADRRTTRLVTTAQDFTDTDTLNLSLLTHLVTVAEWLGEASTGRVENLGFMDALNLEAPSEYKLAVAINIQSPGHVNLSATTITPLVFAALFALFSTANAAEMPKPADIQVVNSLDGGAPDPCTPLVAEAVRRQLQFMQFDAWQQACRRAQQLADGPQLRGPSTARPGLPAVPAPRPRAGR